MKGFKIKLSFSADRKIHKMSILRVSISHLKTIIFRDFSCPSLLQLDTFNRKLAVSKIYDLT